MTNQNPVPKLYKSIVDDVIQSCREIFLDDGIDEQILHELRQLWENKLSHSKAVDNMVQEPEHVISTQFALQQQQAQQQAAKLAAAALALQNNPFYHQSLLAQNIRLSNIDISPSAAAAAMALPPQFYQHFQNVIGNASLFKNSNPYRLGEPNAFVHGQGNQSSSGPMQKNNSSFHATSSSTNEDHIVQIDGSFDFASTILDENDCLEAAKLGEGDKDISIAKNVSEEVRRATGGSSQFCHSITTQHQGQMGRKTLKEGTNAHIYQIDGKYDEDDDDDQHYDTANSTYGASKRRRNDSTEGLTKEKAVKSKKKETPAFRGPSGSSVAKSNKSGKQDSQRKRKSKKGASQQLHGEGNASHDEEVETPHVDEREHPGADLDDEVDDDMEGFVGGGVDEEDLLGEDEADLDTPSSVRSQEEEPLNSQDDVSEEEPLDLFDTDNVVVCQFEKITRSRNKWKFYFKDGIMNINGKDYVFQRALGDAEW